jgi:hypothetical protein
MKKMLIVLAAVAVVVAVAVSLFIFPAIGNIRRKAVIFMPLATRSQTRWIFSNLEK